MTQAETEPGNGSNLSIEAVIGVGRVLISRLRYATAIFEFDLGFEPTPSQQHLLDTGPLSIQAIREQSNPHS
jgi:hypothetical protein